MIIKRFGTDVRSRTAEKILEKALENKGGRLFLFPIPSTTDGVRGKGSERIIEEEIASLGEGDVAAGYGLPGDAERFSCRIADVIGDETFTEENAKITALGALGVLLTEQKRAPCDLSVGVIGYGRIGKELVRLLLFLGAKVCVFSESGEKRNELCSYGIGCKASVVPSPCRRFSGLDALFNTAPARLILPGETAELLGVSVYELASGENLPEGISAKKLPSLPEAMFPVTAGKIYARAVLRTL